jgi:hypothetical protein
MVPTRPIIDTHAFIHGQSVRRMVTGGGPQIRDYLASNPPVVVIPTYRTDYLPEADHAYIRSNYVAVADDFWVLGRVLPAGGGDFNIIHGGRYRISTLKGSDLAETYPDNLAGLLAPEDPGTISGKLDGVPLADRPVELATGPHHLSTDGNSQVAIVWIGPRSSRLHRQGRGDHAKLFDNWF